MTRGELANRLRATLDEDGSTPNVQGTYYSATDYNNSIQDAYDECVGYTGVILKAGVIPFQANRTYYDFRENFSDYLGVIAIWNSLTKRYLSPITRKELYAIDEKWEVKNADPFVFLPINWRYVAIYPKPASTGYGNMWVFYRATAPTLASDDDAILIPAEHDCAVEEYCMMDLYEQQNEFKKAAARSVDYVQEIERLRIWVQNQREIDRIHTLRGTIG